VTQSPSDWTDGYFDELYLELFGFPDAEQTDREISALRTLLPDPPARVLDAACGVGRHAVRLASAGYEVVGLDSSELFLDRANAAAEDAGVAIELVHGDIREIPFGSDFDVVLNLSTAWGYYDDAENQRALQSMADALHPGGRFVLEVAHRDGLVGRYAPRDWSAMSDGTLVVQLREFDAVAGVNIVSHQWRDRDGTSHERTHRLRVHTATEIDHMLRLAGLAPQAWYASFTLVPFTFGARRLLVVAVNGGDRER
jgi:SAM-dependent methyltransferase